MCVWVRAHALFLICFCSLWWYENPSRLRFIVRAQYYWQSCYILQGRKKLTRNTTVFKKSDKKPFSDSFPISLSILIFRSCQRDRSGSKNSGRQHPFTGRVADVTRFLSTPARGTRRKRKCILFDLSYSSLSDRVRRADTLPMDLKQKII